MRILGIDPGFGRVGYGVIERRGSGLRAIRHGLISTPPGPITDRLRLIHDEILVLIDQTQPNAMATERQLFAANRTTALDVAKSLGVILLAGQMRALPWSEYTPPEVKLAVVGNGAADKKQVQFMVAKLLGLAEAPKPDDVADALAIAITHALKTRAAIPR